MEDEKFLKKTFDPFLEFQSYLYSMYTSQNIKGLEQVKIKILN